MPAPACPGWGLKFPVPPFSGFLEGPRAVTTHIPSSVTEFAHKKGSDISNSQLFNLLVPQK